MAKLRPFFLSPSQQRLIWEQVITSVQAGRDLVDARSAAPGAVNAWELLHGWIGALADSEWQATADTRAFFAWQRLYRKQLGQRNWTDSALVPDRLRAEDPHLWIDCARPLLLTGFEEYTPQQQRFLDTLESAGVPLHEIHQDSAAEPITERVVACADRDTEIRSAAESASSVLARDRACSVAIVAPGLESQRARIERIFTEILHPELFLDPSVPRRFNLSLGLPLSSYPLVAAALAALECVRPKIRVEHIGTLLRSPFFSGASHHASARALADSRLRELGAVEISLDRLREVTGRFCPDLTERLNRIPPPPGPSRTFRLGAPVLSCARDSGLAGRPPPHQR